MRSMGGHTNAFGKVHNCSLMMTWENESEKKVLIFNLPCFVYYPECFLSHLPFISDWKPLWAWFCRELHAALDKRMRGTVWPKGQTQTHHITTMSNTGVPFSLASKNLAQEVIHVAAGTGRLTLGKFWEDEIWGGNSTLVFNCSANAW